MFASVEYAQREFFAVRPQRSKTTLFVKSNDFQLLGFHEMSNQDSIVVAE